MLFGTDGVRGVVDKDISTDLAYKIGKGFAIFLKSKKTRNKIIVGMDTRLSSNALTSALSAGLSDYGIDVEIIGIVSTPMISFFVSKLNFDGGVMITASHNDYTYNGIKLFAENGEKLDYESEIMIESNIDSDIEKSLFKGKIIYNEEYYALYKDYLITNFECDLRKLTIVVDCANGSNFKIAPEIYRQFDANVIKVACNNDGENINRYCGANHVETLVQEVLKHNADIGFAFDGDGDRLRIVLSDGRILAGDEILYLFALEYKKILKLKNLTVVGTIMTNMGIEKALNKHCIKLLRTDVGDKNVITHLRANSLSLGGESSGHICIYEHNPSCDALLNSLVFLKLYYNSFDNTFDVFDSNLLYPFLIKNIEVDYEFRKKFNDKDFRDKLDKQIQNEEAKVIVRPSGTEPVIRIYVESESEIKNEKTLQNVLKILKNTTR